MSSGKLPSSSENTLDTALDKLLAAAKHLRSNPKSTGDKDKLLIALTSFVHYTASDALKNSTLAKKIANNSDDLFTVKLIVTDILANQLLDPRTKKEIELFSENLNKLAAGLQAEEKKEAIRITKTKSSKSEAEYMQDLIDELNNFITYDPKKREKNLPVLARKIAAVSEFAQGTHSKLKEGVETKLKEMIQDPVLKTIRSSPEGSLCRARLARRTTCISQITAFSLRCEII